MLSLSFKSDSQARPTDVPFDLGHWAVQVAVVAAMEAGQKRKWNSPFFPM